jgi:hypothetical protein
MWKYSQYIFSPSLGIVLLWEEELGQLVKVQKNAVK